MKSDRPAGQTLREDRVPAKPGADDTVQHGFPEKPRRPSDKPEIPGIEDPEGRRKRIEIAAYHNAEKRGFQAGGELDDWLEAEKRDDALNSRDG